MRHPVVAVVPVVALVLLALAWLSNAQASSPMIAAHKDCPK
jgi:hypothetical protein